MVKWNEDTVQTKGEHVWQENARATPLLVPIDTQNGLFMSYYVPHQNLLSHQQPIKLLDYSGRLVSLTEYYSV